MKVLEPLFKRNKGKFTIPKTVQDTIPIKAVYADGIFLVGDEQYSKTYQFTDINYSVASDDDQRDMFLDYSAFLNSFDDEATTKITINNRSVNRKDIEKELVIPYMQDNLDGYRKEYNDMVVDKAMGSTSIVQEKYITVTVHKDSYEEAKAYFSRIETEFAARLKKLGSKLIDFDVNDRLHILHDFYRIDEDEPFNFDLNQVNKKGHSFKDTICPDSFEFKRDYFRMGDKYGRVIFLREYASGISDKFVITRNSYYDYPLFDPDHNTGCVFWKTAGYNGDSDCLPGESSFLIGPFSVKKGTDYVLSFKIRSLWSTGGKVSVEMIKKTDTDSELPVNFLKDSDGVLQIETTEAKGELFCFLFNVETDMDDCYLRFSFLSPKQEYYLDDVTISRNIVGLSKVVDYNLIHINYIFDMTLFKISDKWLKNNIHSTIIITFLNSMKSTFTCTDNNRNYFFY